MKRLTMLLIVTFVVGLLVASPAGSEPPVWYYDPQMGRLRSDAPLYVEGGATFASGIVRMTNGEMRILGSNGIVYEPGPNTDVIIAAIGSLLGARIYYDDSKDAITVTGTNFTIDGNLVLETPVAGSDSPHIRFKTDATPYGTPDLEARIQLLNNSGDPTLRFQVEDDAVGPTNLTDALYLYDNKVMIPDGSALVTKDFDDVEATLEMIIEALEKAGILP